MSPILRSHSTPFAALALLVLSLSRGTAAAGDLRNQVLEQLGGIEDVPTSASFVSLGPTVGQELRDIAVDSTVTLSKRARAVHALGWFPSDDSHAFLINTLSSTEPSLARGAVHALANGWGEAAIPDIERALAAEDVQLRMAATKALGRLPGVPSREALNRRLSVEPSPAVRESIEKALNAH